MNRTRLWMAVVALMGAHSVFAAPVRVSFLDTADSREATLEILADAECDPVHLDALRKAILHYYQTPLALDVSAFPPAIDGFREFESIGDFVSALGTNQLSYLDHPFELNCFDTALLLAAPDMGISADLQTRNGPFLAVQVTTNFTEWLMPVASLGDVYAAAHPAWYGPFMENRFGLSLTEKHKALVAALYQYQALPLGTSSNTVAAETQEALRRHWTRCGIRFPATLSLAMLHRASTHYHLAVTDHVGVLLQREKSCLYLEKTGGRGPFLRIDVQDPADVAAYLSTGTWPDYPFNFMSIDDETFLPVPLRNADAPQPAADLSTAERAKKAIQRRFSEIAAEQLDDRGYAASSELNLLPGVRMEDVRADLAQGSGQELDGKFRAAHSSSALAVNAFGPWRKNPQALSLLGKTGFDFLQFEKQCPTGLGGIPPNLDLVVAGTDTVIGVESKFLEILAPKPPKFADSYSRENLPQMEPSWWYLMNALKAGPDQYLDAAQLVRHYLGLRNQPEFQGKKIVLLYVFWEPENWRDFPEYRRHREELAAFQEQVKDSAVTFIWTTYPELWDQWTALGLSPDHVKELRKRYGLSI
ncbi:MAG: hypothetical protein AB7V14_12885 [Kiritimatiellia bacterium]